MGRVGRVEATRELVISNTSYLIIYRVKEESVEILRILHSSRKYPEN
jgi:plasmid stabilization system protein ParE